MLSSQLITFLVLVLCKPGECVQGHIPLAHLTVAQCFANDRRIPRNVLDRWQIYVHGIPAYVPVLAWCEEGKRRPAYRRTCFDRVAVAKNVDSYGATRETAHLCVGRTILDDFETARLPYRPGSSGSVINHRNRPR